MVHAGRKAGRNARRARGLRAGASLAGRQAGGGDHPGPGDRNARPLDLRHRPGRAHTLHVRSRRGRVAALVPGRRRPRLLVQPQGALRPLPQDARRLLGGGGVLHVGRRQVPRLVGARRPPLLFEETGKDAGFEVRTLALDGARKPELWSKTKFSQVDSPLSPDGRWLPYSTDESGRWEVYVTAFPRAGRKWQISTNGGAYAFWSADGKEILYHDLSGMIWAVAVSVARGNPRDRSGPSALPGPGAKPHGPVVLADVRPPALPRRGRGAEAKRARGSRRELDAAGARREVSLRATSALRRRRGPTAAARSSTRSPSRPA